MAALTMLASDLVILSIQAMRGGFSRCPIVTFGIDKADLIPVVSDILGKSIFTPLPPTHSL